MIYSRVFSFTLLALFSVIANAFSGITSNFLYWNLYKEGQTQYLTSSGLSSNFASPSTLSELNDPKKDYWDRGFNDFAHHIKIYRSPKESLGWQYEISFNIKSIPGHKELLKQIKGAEDFQIIFQVDNSNPEPIWFRFKKDSSEHIRVINTSKPDNGYRMAETVLINKLKSGRRLNVYLPSTSNKPIVDAIFSLKGFSKATEYISK